jgi:hypothetical protein
MPLRENFSKDFRKPPRINLNFRLRLPAAAARENLPLSTFVAVSLALARRGDAETVPKDAARDEEAGAAFLHRAFIRPPARVISLPNAR